MLYPLAHLGLARAAALTNDTSDCTSAYERFLTLWKAADAGLPRRRRSTQRAGRAAVERGRRRWQKALVARRAAPDNLRRVAARRRRYLGRERQNHTLQPTALVHEAWLRLQNERGAPWHGRTHGLALGAQAMRRLLVDHGRHQKRDKRGGGAQPVALDDLMQAAATQAVPVEDLLTLEEALTGSKPSIRGRRRSSRCGSSRACPVPKSPSTWASRCAPSKATGRMHAPGSDASSRRRTKVPTKDQNRSAYGSNSVRRRRQGDAGGVCRVPDGPWL